MQITRRNKHGVKLRYLLDLIHALECKKVFTAKGVEINFIVPRKNLATYKIGRVDALVKPFLLIGSAQTFASVVCTIFR